jgi:hypothetical protein
MDTALKNSFFCNQNKYLLIKKLESNKNLDLSSDAYLKLFASLPNTDAEKCDILKRIYSFKLNYKNIYPVAEKYCDDSDLFTVVKEMVNIYDVNKLFSSTVPSTPSAYFAKLVNQWFYILSTQNVASDRVVAHLDYVKNLLKAELLSSDYLFIEYKILNYLLDKV